MIISIKLMHITQEAVQLNEQEEFRVEISITEHIHTIRILTKKSVMTFIAKQSLCYD